MKHLSNSKKLWAVLSATLLVLAACDSAPAELVPGASGTGSSGDPAQSVERNDETTAPANTVLPRTSSSAETPSSTGSLASPLATPTALPTTVPSGEVEFTGTVEVIASNMWVVGGRAVAVTDATEIEPGLSVGALAKVHAVPQADGSLWAREIQAASDDDNGNGNSNGNSNDDNGNGNSNGNSNDNNGNSNDDNGNVNSNDDNGNSNDDNGNVNSNDDNGNDDHGNSNGNSNDDNGNSNDDNGNVNSNDDNDDHGNGNSNDDNGNDDYGNSNDNESGT